MTLEITKIQVCHQHYIVGTQSTQYANALCLLSPLWVRIADIRAFSFILLFQYLGVSHLRVEYHYLPTFQVGC